MYTHRFFTTVGGLMSYDTQIADLYRRAAFYIDRILKGVSAGDLPVQLPTKYDLVVNLKVAKALGFTVPLPLLAQSRNGCDIALAAPLARHTSPSPSVATPVCRRRRL
jgi:putative ABC transport system substrate-binding protein